MRATLGLVTVATCLFASTSCVPMTSASTGQSALQAQSIVSNALPKPLPTVLRLPDLGVKARGWLNMGNYSGSLIYLAAGSEIRIFPESGYNQQQIGSITDGVNSSYGLFVDGKRDLFVANAKTISAYHPGTLSPYIVLSDSAGPLYVVKDHSGRVYASNRNGTVSVFQPGQKRPTLTLHTPGTEADGINVDDESNVYVAYRGASGMGSIKKFKPDSRDGRILGMQISQPQGLQLDHAGNILVVDTGKEVLDIFRPHRTSPSQVIPAGDGATQVVLREANDNMYLSDYRDGSVYISHYPPGQFELEFDTDSGAQGMALSNEER